MNLDNIQMGLKTFIYTFWPLCWPDQPVYDHVWRNPWSIFFFNETQNKQLISV